MSTKQKTILITGSTDGIGLETAKMLVSLGHNVLLHGRSPAKLENVERALSAIADGGQVESYVADLSRMADVEALAKAVAEKHAKLDVLTTNALSATCSGTNDFASERSRRFSRKSTSWKTWRVLRLLYVQSDFRKKYKILQKKRDIHLKTWYLKM